MDIFTTQLTRVVPVTIKPEKLKVKGLSKEAKSRKLDQEQDQNDGHQLDSVAQQHANEQYQHELAERKETSMAENEADQADANSTSKKSDDSPHLDIFV